MPKVIDVINSLRDFDPEGEVLVVSLPDGATFDIVDFESDNDFVLIEVEPA